MSKHGTRIVTQGSARLVRRDRRAAHVRLTQPSDPYDHRRWTVDRRVDATGQGWTDWYQSGYGYQRDRKRRKEHAEGKRTDRRRRRQKLVRELRRDLL